MQCKHIHAMHAPGDCDTNFLPALPSSMYGPSKPFTYSIHHPTRTQREGRTSRG
jgi:hypothetical protein